MTKSNRDLTAAENDLEVIYAEALREYLRRGDEEPLQIAYEVGRRYVAQGLGILDMSALHHRVLAEVLPEEMNEVSQEQVLRACAQFQAESFSPFEMAYRGFRESVSTLRHLNDVLEQEIKRIAYSVHDDIGQLLTVAQMSIAEVGRDLDPSLQDRLRDRLLDIDKLLVQVGQRLRQISHELRPTLLDDLGLVPALQFLADGITKRSKLLIHLEASFEHRLPPPLESGLYRIVQEALTNIVKHAHARRAHIELQEASQRLLCSIRDDGVGLDASARPSGNGQKGLGLVGIRERVNAMSGTFEIKSSPDKGTILLVAIPLEH